MTLTKSWALFETAPKVAIVSATMTSEECHSDPLLDAITLHEPDPGRFGGPGWYYTINGSPDLGTFGPFDSCGDCMEAADGELYGE